MVNRASATLPARLSTARHMRMRCDHAVTAHVEQDQQLGARSDRDHTSMVRMDDRVFEADTVRRAASSGSGMAGVHASCSPHILTIHNRQPMADTAEGHS